MRKRGDDRMGFLDELKKLAHPYEDELEDDYDDYAEEPAGF